MCLETLKDADCIKKTDIVWHGQSGYTVALAAFKSEDQTCSIMHEPCCEVDLLHLSPTWMVCGVEVNTVTLPCQHRFHPTALLQHFAYRGMRCPVCRVGEDELININCSAVPTAVAAAVRSHVSVMQTEDSDSDDEHIDAAAVREMLSLRAEMKYNNTTLAIFTSRLIPEDEPTDNQMQCFAPHRSFQRIVLTNAKRTEGTGITMRFQAVHPILLEPIHTEHIPVACLTGDFSMRCIVTGNQVLARIHVEEQLMRVYVDVNAVKNMCCGVLTAHLQHFLGN